MTRARAQLRAGCTVVVAFEYFHRPFSLFPVRSSCRISSRPQYVLQLSTGCPKGKAARLMDWRSLRTRPASWQLYHPQFPQLS